MSQLNINFGMIPNIQTVDRNQSFLHRMITSLIENDNILTETINLNENNQNNTSREFINNLEEIDVTDEIIKKYSECSICLESFKKGDKCIKLPCKDNPHYFHANNDNCPGIKNWLETNNTCPLCRSEFPKENNISNDSSNILIDTGFRWGDINVTTDNDIIPETNTDNTIHQNINSASIINSIDNIIRSVNDEINEIDDLQRTIELSLNDY